MNALTFMPPVLTMSSLEIEGTGTSERNGHSFIETKFTTKGLVWVAGLWAVHQLRVA